MDLKLVRLLRDIFLKNLAFGSLRIAKVHHFVHELVDNNEVIPYTLLFEFLEVLDENLDKPVQKDDNFSGIAISF